MRTPWLLTAAALLSLASTVATAQEVEHRAFSLTDGRNLLGVVLESGVDGMTMRVPQGIATVPYALLGDIGVSDATAVQNQGHLILAVAPVQASELDARAMAAQIDSWLADAAGLIPHSTVLSATSWEDAVGGSGFDLVGCGGKIDCLAPLATTAGAERVLLPSLSLSDGVATLTIVAHVASTGAEIARDKGLTGASPETAGADALTALFGALALGPEIDVAAVAAKRFSPPAVAETAPETETPPAEEAAETVPALEASVQKAPDLELIRTLALGFAPVPGLNGAVNEDPPAFLSALLGGVGSAWAAIYGVGTTARTPEAFVGPALGSAYGLVVGWNEVAGLIGLAVQRAKGATAAGPLAPAPVFTLVPVIAANGEPGVVFGLSGRF